MKQSKIKKLKKAGWRVGNADDFLENRFEKNKEDSAIIANACILLIGLILVVVFVLNFFDLL